MKIQNYLIVLSITSFLVMGICASATPKINVTPIQVTNNTHHMELVPYYYSYIRYYERLYDSKSAWKQYDDMDGDVYIELLDNGKSLWWRYIYFELIASNGTCVYKTYDSTSYRFQNTFPYITYTARGEFPIHNLPAGHYQLIISYPGNGDIPPVNKSMDYYIAD